MFPRVTHPSATDVLRRPFDLHVLSLPPAFVLSQDQTLKFNLKINPDWSLFFRAGPPKGPAPRLDEFQTHPLKWEQNASPPHGGPPSIPKSAMNSSENVTVSVSSGPQPQSPRTKAITLAQENQRQSPRKDNAAHVSLLSDAIVKQQRIRKSAPSADLRDPINSSLASAANHLAGDRLELKLSDPALPRDRDDRKVSGPATQQGGSAHTKSRNSAVHAAR